MPIVGWIALWIGISIAIIAYIRVSDARWYRKHPGANDYFARLDDELTAIGE